MNFRSNNPNMIGREDLAAHYSPYDNSIRKSMQAVNKKRFFEENQHHKSNALIYGAELARVSPAKVSDFFLTVAASAPRVLE
jgi:hypothetical protein